MPVRTIQSSFLDKFLDPATSLGEILFGLVMTLTFTLAAGVMVTEEGREGARQMLAATIGCNVAWGVIDAAFYVLEQVFERGRRRRLAHAIREAPSAAAAVSQVAGELDELLGPVLTDPERAALYERVAARVRAATLRPGSITRADLAGAFASFCLVFFASIPAAIPFLVLENARLALRVSNALLLALLFGVGWWWARYTVAKPWRVGAAFLVVGVGLVAMAIALGG